MRDRPLGLAILPRPGSSPGAVVSPAKSLGEALLEAAAADDEQTLQRSKASPPLAKGLTPPRSSQRGLIRGKLCGKNFELLGRRRIPSAPVKALSVARNLLQTQ